MDQSGSSASLLENRRNPVLLPKVLSRHHFDIDLMAARQTDDVVSNLPGDRLSETRQVSRAKSRLIHGNQQCAWVRNIHQCAMDNDPIKTTQLTGTFLGVAAFQVGAQSRFQRGSSRSGSSHERLLYSSLWFWLCQFRTSGLDGGRFLQQALFGLLQRTAGESMLSGADQKVSCSGSLPYHLGNVHRSFPGRMIVTSPGLTPCQLSRSVSHRHFGIGGLVAGAVCPASVVPRFRVAEGDGNEV